MAIRNSSGVNSVLQIIRISMKGIVGRVVQEDSTMIMIDAIFSQSISHHITFSIDVNYGDRGESLYKFLATS